MTITARDFQPTELNPAAHAERRRHLIGDGTDPNRIGVVFVHGIGTQQPAETFLNWSKPIVELLTAWRTEHHTVQPDPVVRAQFSFSGASQPYLELDVPEITLPDSGTHPRRQFVITEAWWAAQIRAPSLGDAAAYVFRAFPKILARLANSYEHSHGRMDQVSARIDEAAASGTNPMMVQELQRRGRWAWIDALDGIQRFLSVLAYLPALAIGGFFLLVYAPFRLIPIKPIQDAAVLRSVDNFLTTWFGDLPDILDDPVQAANVRARLAESIDRLATEQRCGSIVIVAHSGGAIVSFTTLLDPAYWKAEVKRLEVQRLITIGEALALGWLIDDTGKGRATRLTDRLTGDLAAARPELKWTDVWSTYDPAPAGPLRAPAGVTLPPIDDRPVTNRMSVLEDHGAYWDNDEGFLIPLVRYLDEARGDPNDSRFFRDPAERAVRIERRRQRVGVLALWRWIAVLAAVVPIVGGTLAWAVSGGSIDGPAGFGRAVGAWFETVPFHQLVTGPLGFLADIGDLPAVFADIGQWLVGAITIAVVFVLIAVAGLKLWARWDERERAIARREPLEPVHRMDVAVVSATVLAITLAAAAWASAQVFG